MPMEVCLEVGRKRTFAGALEWPGWCRSAGSEDLALEALRAYRPRYAAVTAVAAIPLPEQELRVVERLPGSATTDFGAPGAIAAADRAPLDAGGADRIIALLEAAWAVLDRVCAGAPAELTRGPRGGGRDRDAIFEHVLAAETAYGRKLGVRHRQPLADDRDSVSALRDGIARAIGSPAGADPAGTGWPPRYAARRIAWHVLDHAWEIEDRTP